MAMEKRCNGGGVRTSLPEEIHLVSLSKDKRKKRKRIRILFFQKDNILFRVKLSYFNSALSKLSVV